MVYLKFHLFKYRFEDRISNMKILRIEKKLGFMIYAVSCMYGKWSLPIQLCYYRFSTCSWIDSCCQIVLKCIKHKIEIFLTTKEWVFEDYMQIDTVHYW